MSRVRRADQLYYSAEAAAGVALLGACPDLQDAQRFLAHHIRQPWWASLCPSVPEIELRYIPKVQFSGTTRERGKFVISCALNRLHEGIIAHEMAHVPTWNPDIAHLDHGRAFALAHLEILRNVADPWLVARFRHELESRGILSHE
jgi:hypothetical protein